MFAEWCGPAGWKEGPHEKPCRWLRPAPEPSQGGDQAETSKASAAVSPVSHASGMLRRSTQSH